MVCVDDYEVIIHLKRGIREPGKLGEINRKEKEFSARQMKEKMLN